MAAESKGKEDKYPSQEETKTDPNGGVEEDSEEEAEEEVLGVTTLLKVYPEKV